MSEKKRFGFNDKQNEVANLIDPMLRQYGLQAVPHEHVLHYFAINCVLKELSTGREDEIEAAIERQKAQLLKEAEAISNEDT